MTLTVSIQKNHCGICEQLGADKLWLNHVSPYAHPICVRWIQEIDNDLQKTINLYFSNSFYRHQAHAEAIEQIKKQIGKKTIFEYLQTEGRENLSKAFSSRDVAETLLRFQKNTQRRTQSNATSP